MIQYLRCLVLMILLTSLGVEKGVAYQDEVDWIWNDRKPTVRLGPVCMKFIVKAYPIKIVRGNISGHACLENSIASFRKGDHEKALGWILAGQCHDRLAQETLVKHAPKVLEYVWQKYGNEVSEKKPRPASTYSSRQLDPGADPEADRSPLPICQAHTPQ